ncbi:MAG TPA: YceI family protein [Solirubrobacteraceae bacterium]|nr:YceI family protein [Solirubrobacteraceae bacterium]
MTSPINPAEAATRPTFADGTWRLNLEHSELGFAAKSIWGLVTVRGGFGVYDAVVRVQSGEVAGELTIDATSVDTRNAKRDRHLRSADFLDAAQHPQIVFRRARIISVEGGFTAAGELLVGAHRAELELPLRVEWAADGALRLDGEATFSRALVGITWNWLGSVGDQVQVHAGLTLRRQP